MAFIHPDREDAVYAIRPSDGSHRVVLEREGIQQVSW